MFDQMTGFIESALQQHGQDQEQISSLQSKVADAQKQERVLLEKVAKQTLTDNDIEQTMDRLEQLRLIDPKQRVKLASEIRAKPASVLSLLDTISERLINAPSEGEGLSKDANAPGTEVDPDGWSDFTEGRRVKLKS